MTLPQLKLYQGQFQELIRIHPVRELRIKNQNIQFIDAIVALGSLMRKQILMR